VPKDGESSIIKNDDMSILLNELTAYPATAVERGARRSDPTNGLFIQVCIC
jgi:hypothetical protein